MVGWHWSKLCQNSYGMRLRASNEAMAITTNSYSRAIDRVVFFCRPASWPVNVLMEKNGTQRVFRWFECEWHANLGWPECSCWTDVGRLSSELAERGVVARSYILIGLDVIAVNCYHYFGICWEFGNRYWGNILLYAGAGVWGEHSPMGKRIEFHSSSALYFV